MMTDATPKRAKLKVTVPALPHAYDLLNHLLSDGRAQLGADPGCRYAETVAGHHLLACRLDDGGVMVREVMAIDQTGCRHG